ncbi:hypothetical protein L1049_007075 [Liquidambar formosana]|uniref:Helicase XPB/Ssl2 N-terminal domain-containing protein n=1 Tax=Liquidambar formosana TaxID=63359 RepID=A0AAP0RJZ8_LIQFO
MQPDRGNTIAQDEDAYIAEEFHHNYRNGEKEGKKNDYTKLELKPDHAIRPLWVCGDGRIFLETFSPLYKHACDFLIAIAEPICRPELMHGYNLTPHSLYAAVSVGLETETIIAVLNKLSKTKLPKDVINFIHACTANYGKVKLVLKKNRYFVKSPFPKARHLCCLLLFGFININIDLGLLMFGNNGYVQVLKTLLQDEAIAQGRICPEGSLGGDGFTISKAVGEIEGGHDGLLNQAEQVAAAGEKETHLFEIDPSQVENVKQRCLSKALNYPMLEEYDFRNDTVNPNLDMELKPQA